MSNLDATARDQLLLNQFLAALPPTVRQQLRATGEAKTLEAAVERTRLAFRKGPSDVEQLKEQIGRLTEQVQPYQHHHSARPTVSNRSRDTVSPATVWGTSSVTAHTTTKVQRVIVASHAGDKDIWPGSAIRETTKGHLSGATGAFSPHNNPT